MTAHRQPRGRPKHDTTNRPVRGSPWLRGPMDDGGRWAPAPRGRRIPARCSLRWRRSSPPPSASGLPDPSAGSRGRMPQFPCRALPARLRPRSCNHIRRADTRVREKRRMNRPCQPHLIRLRPSTTTPQVQPPSQAPPRPPPDKTPRHSIDSVNGGYHDSCTDRRSRHVAFLTRGPPHHPGTGSDWPALGRCARR